MKRFIDLRGQYTGFRFAWYDTVVDMFEWFGDPQNQAFDSWEDFIEVCPEDMQERYKSLCPQWVFEIPPDADALPVGGLHNEM